MADEETYPTECVQCGVEFKPGDTFWYDILDDIKGDMCGKCAHRVSFMESATIPIQEKEKRNAQSNAVESRALRR